MINSNSSKNKAKYAALALIKKIVNVAKNNEKIRNHFFQFEKWIAPT